MKNIKIEKISEEDEKVLDKIVDVGNSLDNADRWIRNPNDNAEF